MVPAELSGPAVMQAYEFRHDGRITHWEFESDKTGVVQLQVSTGVLRAALHVPRKHKPTGREGEGSGGGGGLEPPHF